MKHGVVGNGGGTGRGDVYVWALSLLVACCLPVAARALGPWWDAGLEALSPPPGCGAALDPDSIIDLVACLGQPVAGVDVEALDRLAGGTPTPAWNPAANEGRSAAPPVPGAPFDTVLVAAHLNITGPFGLMARSKGLATERNWRWCPPGRSVRHRELIHEGFRSELDGDSPCNSDPVADGVDAPRKSASGALANAGVKCITAVFDSPDRRSVSVIPGGSSRCSESAIGVERNALCPKPAAACRHR